MIAHLFKTQKALVYFSCRYFFNRSRQSKILHLGFEHCSVIKTSINMDELLLTDLRSEFIWNPMVYNSFRMWVYDLFYIDKIYRYLISIFFSIKFSAFSVLPFLVTACFFFFFFWLVISFVSNPIFLQLSQPTLHWKCDSSKKVLKEKN